MVIFHLCVIYFVTVFHTNQGYITWSGTVVYSDSWLSCISAQFTAAGHHRASVGSWLPCGTLLHYDIILQTHSQVMPVQNAYHLHTVLHPYKDGRIVEFQNSTSCTHLVLHKEPGRKCFLSWTKMPTGVETQGELCETFNQFNSIQKRLARD